MKKAKATKRQSKAAKIFKICILSLLVLTFSVIIFMVSYLFGIEEWQQFDAKEIRQNMEISLRLYDKEGEEYLSLAGTQDRRYVKIEEIPEHVRNAFIAIEDARFYEHGGIDLIRIGGALIEDIKSGSIEQGASTISQQLIKLSQLKSDQTVRRKLAEIMMAFKLEKEYSKDEILELYLNEIYFGRGAYGIENAARFYFGKSAKDLSVAEGALLAGILKSPTNYAPHINMEKSLERRNLVLSQMVENGFLSEAEAETARQEPVALVEKQESQYLYGFYTDMVLSDACEILGIGYSELMSGGYQIYTNLDQQLQQHLEETAKDTSLFPANAEDGSNCECAMVVLSADSGEILGLLGGREHTTRLAFNRATSMRRQPGSASKPVLVYAPALEYLEYDTTSTLMDEPTDFSGYTPRNSGNTYRGWVSMRDCVAYSINIPAVKLLQEVGVERAKDYASMVGIPFDQRDDSLSLALGGFTTGVSPLELAGAYQPFASGGYYCAPSAISKIVDRDGNIVYQKDEEKNAVLSSQSAFLMSSMLESTVQYGTAKSALSELDMELSAKTGTSTYDDASNNKDAWVVAYNSEYIVCCWMGFDKTDAAHSLPKGVTGGSYPARFAAKIFSYLYQQKEAPQLEQPSGIERVLLNKRQLEKHNVMLASKREEEDNIAVEYFRKEKIPAKAAVMPEDFRVSQGPSGAPVITFSAEKNYRYILERKDPGAGEFEKIATIPGGTAYTDRTAEKGHAYIYRLSPADYYADDAYSGIYAYSPGSGAVGEG